MTAALCNGRRHRRRSLSAMAACDGRPLQRPPLSLPPFSCDGRSPSRPPRHATAAASAAARILFVPSELSPLWVPVLRPALLCGPLFLSMLNYRTANCPRMAAAPCHVSVERPAALFCISTQPNHPVFGWLFITHLLLVVNGELDQFALHHQHFMWLPCFCFSCHASLQQSTSTCHVLSALHRVRVQLPVRHLQQTTPQFAGGPWPEILRCWLTKTHVI
jgi:hypothetical protein